MFTRTFMLALICLSIDNSFQQELTKLLVATGKKGTLISVEVINLDEANPGQKCDNLPDLPTGLKGPTGQLFNKTTPIICGAIDDLCDCFQLVKEVNETGYASVEWVTHSSPAECGAHAKSVSLTAGENKENLEKNDIWLITGGLVGSTPLNRVEAFDGKSWKYNAVKTLPVGVYLHCLVKLNDTVLFLIGGTTTDENASGHTFAYDNGDDSWTKGPELTEPRSGHACGIISSVNPKTGENEKVIVVAGGSTGTNYAATVEILRISAQGEVGDKWETGPALPKNVLFGTMVQYKETVILIGGGGDDIVNGTLPSFDGDQLFQLKSAEGPWEELPQKLQEKRSQHTSFLIPDDLVNCQ